MPLSTARGVFVGRLPAVAAPAVDPLPSAAGQPASDTSLRAIPVAQAILLPTGAFGLIMAGMPAAAISPHNTYLCR